MCLPPTGKGGRCSWEIGLEPEPQAVDRQTQPVSTLWSASVLPGKGYEASNTKGPPGRRWKEGPPSPPPAGWELCVSCALPRDHRGGKAGGGVAPEKSAPQLMGPLSCGLCLQPCTVPEAGTCLLCIAASLCVELGLDSDPALRPARRSRCLPTSAPAWWPRAMTEGMRAISGWLSGSVWRPGWALRASRGLSHRRGLGLCPAPRPGWASADPPPWSAGQTLRWCWAGRSAGSARRQRGHRCTPLGSSGLVLERPRRTRP